MERNASELGTARDVGAPETASDIDAVVAEVDRHAS
jgi:hypothetical protein